MSTKQRRTSGANVRSHVMSGAKPFSVDKDAVAMLLAAFGYPRLAPAPPSEVRMFAPHQQEEQEDIDT